MKKTEMIKSTSLRFSDPNCSAAIKFVDGDEKKKPELVMTAYSGGIIEGHWYWGNLAIDLEGLKIPAGKIPILEDHQTSQKIGFSTKWSKEDNKLTLVKSTFVDSPESLEFRELSGQGFPYQASIYAKPSKIQRLSEDETAMVNGFEMKGPGSIWRKCELKEASVVTFGYDSNTKAAAMAEDGEEEFQVEIESKNNPQEEETKGMKKEQFKKEHEGEYNAIVAEVTTAVTATVTDQVTTDVTASFADEKKILETKLADAVAANTKLTDENTASERRILKLEQKDDARALTDIATAASDAFSLKFKAAALPERLSEKIQRLVSHDQFVVDGVLDLVKFNEAIDTELAGWTADDADSVQGLSTSRNAAEELSDEKESDETAARMLSHLGQKVKE